MVELPKQTIESFTPPPLYGEAKVYQLIESFSDEKLADLQIWLAGRPFKGPDPVMLAIGSFNALKEDEVPIYFLKLRESMSPDLWDILTSE